MIRMYKIVDIDSGYFYGGDNYGTDFYKSRSYSNHKSAEQERLRILRLRERTMGNMCLKVKCYGCNIEENS